MRFEHVLHVRARPETVWRLTTDIERLPSVTPTITAVRRFDSGPLRVGSAAELRQPKLRPAVWTVTELEENRRFVWEAKFMGSRMIATHVITSHGDGCTNTLILEMRGLPRAVLGRIAAKQLRAALATENQSFKTHAEAAR